MLSVPEWTEVLLARYKRVLSYFSIPFQVLLVLLGLARHLINDDIGQM